MEENQKENVFNELTEGDTVWGNVPSRVDLLSRQRIAIVNIARYLRRAEPEFAIAMVKSIEEERPDLKD